MCFLSNWKSMIPASTARIIPLTTIDRSTPMVEKNTSDVTTLPINDPIVEKNRSFPITTAFFSSLMSSDMSGIVWLARNTGRKKRTVTTTNIGKKYPISNVRSFSRNTFSKGKLMNV